MSLNLPHLSDVSWFNFHFSFMLTFVMLLMCFNYLNLNDSYYFNGVYSEYRLDLIF